MKSNKKILFLINELQYTCGITSSIFNLLADSDFRKTGEFYIICGGEDAAARFREMGIKVHVNSNILHQQRSIFKYFKAHFQLWKIIRKWEINIIHSHHYFAASIAWNLKKISAVSTIQSCHGLIPETGVLGHFTADHIIAVNQHIYDYILSRKIKRKEHVHLIRYGLPQSSRKENNINNVKIRFMAASRIEYEKGLDTYIKAVSLLPREYLERAEFSIAGTGSWVPDMQNLISTLGAEIKYLGKLTDLNSALEYNHVFVMPSRSDSEGFPMAVIEAALKRNLIITSDFRGSEYIIEDNKDALVFSREDYHGLAEKIISTIDKYDTYSEMINNFCKKAEELYNIRNAVNNLWMLYDNVLQTK